MQHILRIIAVLSFIVAIAWMVIAPGFEPVLAFLAGITTLLTSFAIDKSKGETETLDQRNRRVMLNHVENFWVKGVLEKSLHGAALLELGIKEDLTAVSYPWGIKRESTGETLPEGKSMLEIFQEIGMGRSLLILGAPGSGKTTILLELARHLIEHARQDETEPIPVVFNLASLNEKQTLVDWLVEQLNMLYYVPKKTAVAWVNENRMLLLLDGLDEVKQSSREKCVEAINQFRNKYGLTSLVVCSRSQEYKEIREQLPLLFESAIEIQKLTSEQVNKFIDRFGNRFAGLRLCLQRDSVLQELAGTPLMLSVMAIAYREAKPEELIKSGDAGEQRNHLFNTYIERMFERSSRKTNIQFTKEQTLHYLNWIAQKMLQNNLITYQIETMQPTWLNDDDEPCVFMRFVGLSKGLTIDMVDKLKWSLKKAREQLITGMVFGLIIGLVIWLSIGLLVGGLSKELPGRLIEGLIFGLLGGMSLGLFLGLQEGLIGEQIEETTDPGQRLKQTLYNAVLVAISGGLMVWLIFVLLIGLGLWLSSGLIEGLSFGMMIGLIYGLIFGLLVGLLAGLQYGILALVQHYTLRIILIRNGFLPWALISFLEYAVDLIFLRRIGGSYIFIHRTLMEHFAEMDV